MVGAQLNSFRLNSATALSMPIGKLTLELSIPHAQSLKDRRQVVRSLKDKLRHAFNLSIAELNEGATLYNQATFAIAVVSSSMQSLTQHLESIDRAAHRIAFNLSAEIADSYAEILSEDSEPVPLAEDGDPEEIETNA
jgi:uncharacterized protein YlxP (DUF503 family)